MLEKMMTKNQEKDEIKVQRPKIKKVDIDYKYDYTEPKNSNVKTTEEGEDE